MVKEKGRLTARQIELWDAINLDEYVAEHTFKVAMSFYSNRLFELTKQKEKFWEEMHEILGTKQKIDKLKVKREDGYVVVTKE